MVATDYNNATPLHLVVWQLKRNAYPAYYPVNRRANEIKPAACSYCLYIKHPCMHKVGVQAESASALSEDLCCR